MAAMAHDDKYQNFHYLLTDTNVLVKLWDILLKKKKKTDQKLILLLHVTKYSLTLQGCCVLKLGIWA